MSRFRKKSTYSTDINLFSQGSNNNNESQSVSTNPLSKSVMNLVSVGVNENNERNSKTKIRREIDSIK